MEKELLCRLFTFITSMNAGSSSKQKVRNCLSKFVSLNYTLYRARFGVFGPRICIAPSSQDARAQR